MSFALAFTQQKRITHATEPGGNRSASVKEEKYETILIIGMGRFGRHLCQNLAELGNQIMIVDQEEENLEEMLPLVVSAKNR